MAPQKRKTGGRVTAAGTRPGEKARGATATATADGAHHESSRYTAPAAKAHQESPPWVPILMLVFFGIGALAIISRYLWWDSNTPMVAGMGFLLAGLFTATKWR